MSLSRADWDSIDRRIEDSMKQISSPAFAQGVVIKANAAKNLVWLKEFGDQPIPMFTFDYEIKYYDTRPAGNVTSGQPVDTRLIAKKAIVKPLCPKVGDTVLVARQYGSRRLPKCLGVLRSKDFEAISD